jgi:CheY-like chemotaxis protein
MSSPEAQANRNCRSILVVEDDQDIRESLTEVLQVEGYDVEGAINGREALEKLRRKPKPCLILLDLMMDEMNGWEFLEAQRKEGGTIATIPVVVITAAGESKIQTLEGRTQAVMKKPIDLEALLDWITRFCGPPEPKQI